MSDRPPDGAADARFMRAALDLAARGLGRVWPNPAVGCVIVDADGRIVGEGWTQPGGRPHAETEALRQAGERARGGAAYVTLEPCSHHGRTPPCADALIAAGLARVVVACGDPDPRVNGAGLKRLERAGVAVTFGVCESEAAALNEGFFRRVRDGRPATTLKCATSLDGRIALASGASKWITAVAARAAGHELRATHDAIAVGVGTALADDPELTCRLPGREGRSPVRIVFDSALRTPPSGRMFKARVAAPIWILHGGDADAARAAALRDAGAELVAAPTDRDGRVDATAALRVLGDRGLTRLLIEGGGRLAAALLRADRIDRIEWFRAPILIGGDGVPAVGTLGLDALDGSPRFRRAAIRELGDDVQETYVRL